MKIVTSLTFLYSFLASGILAIGVNNSLTDYNEIDKEMNSVFDGEAEYFIGLGEKEIELGHDKVVLVVGLPGAGKTTLVQFIANDTNKLKAVEVDGQFIIVDEGQLQNETRVSKSFLPQLVYHEESSTAYYNCPGFNDNQNASIQVANMYFIKMIVRHATSVKIIVVASENTLGEMNNVPLLNLLKAVVGLLKNLDKFEGGISLVITSSSPGHSPDGFTFLRRYAKFLKTQVPQLMLNRRDELPKSVEKLITAILQTSSSYLNEPERLGYFRAPITGGYLNNHPLFQENKQFLIDLVNKTKNIASASKDFGYVLSADARALLRRLVMSLFEKIGDGLAQLEIILSETLQARSSKILTSSGYTDIASFSEVVKKWKNMDFPDCKSIFVTTPLQCIESFEAIITSYDIAAGQYFEDLKGYSRSPYSLLFDSAEEFIEYSHWTMPFSDTYFRLNEIFSTLHLPKREAELGKQYSLFAQNLVDSLKFTLNRITNISSAELVTLKETLSEIQKSDFKNCLMDPGLIPSKYTTEIAESIYRTGGNTTSGLFEDITKFGKALDELRNTTQLTFKIEPSNWVQPLIKILPDVRNHIGIKTTPTVFTKFIAIMQSPFSNFKQHYWPKFNSTSDITTKIEAFKKIVRTLSSLEYIFEHWMSKEDSTPEAIVQSLMRLYIFPGFDALEEELKFLESQLAILGILGNDEWRKEKDWHLLFEDLRGPFLEELNVNTFLLDLFKDLTEFEVQVGDGILHPWWLSAGQIKMDNFGDFWQKGKEAGLPSIKKGVKKDIEDILNRRNESLVRLGNLLDTTLSPNSFPCPSPNKGNLFLKAKFVTMSNISDCAKQHPDTRNIYVTADYVLFLDNDFVGRSINQEGNVNLFIISPFLNIRDNKTIDLSGGKASNKVSGGHAGNAFIIADERNGGVLQILVDGGDGGIGFEGQPGKDGEKGKDKSHFNDSRHCDAWSDGTIRISFLPNSCNNDMEEKCRGNWYVEIYGDPGTRGENGGNGTDGGLGGRKGEVITAYLTSSVSKRFGRDGLPGVGGNGGVGGRLTQEACKGFASKILTAEVESCLMTLHQMEQMVTMGSFWKHVANLILIKLCSNSQWKITFQGKKSFSRANFLALLLPPSLRELRKMATLKNYYQMAHAILKSRVW